MNESMSEPTMEQPKVRRVYDAIVVGSGISGGWAAKELAERGLEAYSFHPGYVATSFGADSPLVKFANLVSRGRLAVSSEQGAEPIVQLATVETVGVPSGTYFDGLQPNGRVHFSAEGAEEGLWAASAALVGL